MFSQYFQSIDGIATYPLISLFIFLPFFILIIFIAATMNKKHIDHMSRLPLDNIEKLEGE